MTRRSHWAPTATTWKGHNGAHPDCDPLRQMLRTVLLDRMRAGRDTTGRIGTLECRAVLTLYSLLTEHPVDQWGRCQSCRHPGWMLLPQWWPYRVSSKAELYLQRVDEVLLLDMLTDNLGLDTAPPPLEQGPAVR
jgi:hypothetical protein